MIVGFVLLLFVLCVYVVPTDKGADIMYYESEPTVMNRNAASSEDGIVEDVGDIDGNQEAAISPVEDLPISDDFGLFNPEEQMQPEQGTFKVTVSKKEIPKVSQPNNLQSSLSEYDPVKSTSSIVKELMRKGL